MFTAIVAVGTALAGTAGAKNLLVEQGWYTNQSGSGSPEATSTSAAENMCPDVTDETCLYHFDEGASTPDRKISGQFSS
ncbi:hypothetical protein ACS126_06115 [Sphingobacterium lactis]|uniref:hypothetical protein n=2 Tax=Sphingobacteriaceae TaxID=84566 RepID=UPI003EC53B33